MNRILSPGTLLCVLLLSGGSAAAGTVSGIVSAGGKPAAGVIVYLESQTEPVASKTPARVVMDQKDLAFVPGTLPVVRGTVVDFRNSDDVEHNVFSPSEEVTHFDLGTYRRGESRSVQFDRIGEIQVLCNIHMEMAARILVVRDPYFARAGSDGAFRVDGVPAGTYTLRIWRDRWSPSTPTVEVRGEGVTTVDIADP